MLQLSFLGKRKPLKEIDKPVFRLVAKSLASEHSKSHIRLTYVLVTDEDLLHINREFLQHDYYTDIITFDLGSEPSILEGEVYISIDRVYENAITYHVNPSEELLRVLFHGLLHLCGYKDHTKTEQKTMRKMEAQCLNLYRETLASVSRETKA